MTLRCGVAVCCRMHSRLLADVSPQNFTYVSVFGDNFEVVSGGVESSERGLGVSLLDHLLRGVSVVHQKGKKCVMAQRQLPNVAVLCLTSTLVDKASHPNN
jgi:hypothetical protein